MNNWNAAAHWLNFQSRFMKAPFFNSVSAFGKSILLITTMQGIFFSLMILMTYKVCFFTPYVADMIKTTRSVIVDPLSLIFVNA